MPDIRHDTPQIFNLLVFNAYTHPHVSGSQSVKRHNHVIMLLLHSFSYGYSS